MATTDVILAKLLFAMLTGLVICVNPSDGMYFNWNPFAERKPAKSTDATIHQGNYTRIPECPLRPCYFHADKIVSFSCPLSGCTHISHRIMQDVQYLKLQDNNITAIPELPFASLQDLDLADNNISRIDDNAFTKLTNLTMLYLSNNKITSLKRIHFQSLLNLKYLYLDQNRITIINDDVFFPALISIIRLDLSTNRIVSIDESALTQMLQLKFLHLERNYIRTITRAHLTQLPQLAELTLNQNQISEIEPFTFGDLNSLRQLDLGYNRIKRLQNNSFSIDSPELFHSSLLRLVLNNNSIESMEVGAFSGLHSLQVLHFPYNPLKEFPTCHFPPSLRVISMHHMLELRSIPKDAFPTLRKLHTAEIYANPKLSTVSPGSFGGDFAEMELLDLSRNNLRTMPESVVSDWKLFARVDLSGNPWHCDCRLRWMKEVYMSVPERQAIRCSSPPRLSGKSIASVTVEELLCGIEVMGVNMRRRTGFLLILLTSLLFSCFLAVFLYRYRHRAFPCYYGQTSRYSALYSPKEEDGEEEEAVTIAHTPTDPPASPGATITVSESEKKLLRSQSNGAPPAPVAL